MTLYDMEPRGDYAERIRFAHQTCAIGNLIAGAAGAKSVRFKPEDFLLEFKQQEEEIIHGDSDSAKDFAAIRQLFGIK